jgi:Zn-dependent protease
LVIQDEPNQLFVGLGFLTVIINVFNLVPAEPLDGGIALRSVFRKLVGDYARFGLMGLGILLIALGWTFGLLVLMIFGGIAVLANIKDRKIDPGLDSLTSLQTTISIFCYIAMGSAYITLLKFFNDRLAIPTITT